jgi:hypothetical protein
MVWGSCTQRPCTRYDEPACFTNELIAPLLGFFLVIVFSVSLWAELMEWRDKRTRKRMGLVGPDGEPLSEEAVFLRSLWEQTREEWLSKRKTESQIDHKDKTPHDDG